MMIITGNSFVTTTRRHSRYNPVIHWIQTTCRLDCRPTYTASQQPTTHGDWLTGSPADSYQLNTSSTALPSSDETIQLPDYTISTRWYDIAPQPQLLSADPPPTKTPPATATAPTTGHTPHTCPAGDDVTRSLTHCTWAGALAAGLACSAIDARVCRPARYE